MKSKSSERGKRLRARHEYTPTTRKENRNIKDQTTGEGKDYEPYINTHPE